ncbi:MAG: thioredoxin-dependent thiol peroxidase [Desulfurobacteriaceae bacterium]
MALNIGEKAPEFCLLDENGKKVCLEDYKGKWSALYFYPRDNTPGCTREAQDFSELLGEFENLNAVILGVSPDSVEKHKRFKEKKGLKVKLLSDPDKKVIGNYDVWKLKKVCGRECYGVVRTTYLIDPNGQIVHVWEKVKVKGHAKTVLKKLKELQGGEG